MFFGFLSNKTRVVLHDTRNQTYLFVLVENLRRRNFTEENTVDSIMRSVQHQEGYMQCTNNLWH